MNKRIVYMTDDNKLAVIIPATSELSIEDIAKKDVPNGKNYKIIDVSDLPSDRTYRDAWVLNNNTVEIDENKKAELYGA